MTVRAYILIECEAARAGPVSVGLTHLAVAHAKVVSADTMSGPFDVIVLWNHLIWTAWDALSQRESRRSQEFGGR